MLNSETQTQTNPLQLDQTQTDALLETINEQIASHSFDSNNQDLLKQMVECLGDPRGMVRLGFAEALGKVGKPATPLLLAALSHHSNPVVRRAAGKTLTLIADPIAVPTLVQSLLNDEDTVVKGSCVGALARTGKEAVPALLAILASSEYPESAKGHAAWALSFIGSEAAEFLYPALNSDSVDVRCAVVGALAQVAQAQANDQARQLLISALRDTAPVVRTEAAASWSQIDYPPAIPHLIAALQDADGEVTKAAVSSLGKIGDRTAVTALQAALSDELEAVRHLAKLAIAQIEKQSA